MRNFTLAFLLYFIVGHSYAATVVFQHSGNADPTTEGWTQGFGGGGLTSSGPVTNDLGLGIDAWFVEDTGLGGGTTEFYIQTPTGTQLSDASSLGWNFSGNIRVVDGTTGTFDTHRLDYIDGSTQWLMSFDTDGAGDPIVTVHMGPVLQSYTVTGGGGSYHSYSLRFDPNAGSADLFVDGIERISNYTGTAIAGSRVLWGAGNSDGTGLAHYNSVEWSVGPAAVPVPAAVWLFGSGLMGLIGVARRKKA